MKKLKIMVTLGTVFVTGMLFLGCGKNTVEKTSISLEDIDQMPIPEAYSYEKFEGEKSIDTGKGNFDSDAKFCNLFPEQASVTEKTISESQIANKRICTDLTVSFEDGSKCDLHIENDPKTLELLDASVENGKRCTIYTYKY